MIEGLKNPSVVRDKKALKGFPIRPMRVSPFRLLCATLTCCSQHPNAGWSKESPAFRENVINHVEKPGLHHQRRRLRFEKIVTADDRDSSHDVHNRAKFNMAQNFLQMLHKRPNHLVEDLKDVYLVGGGSHPGSGLPVIYESARVTSRLIAEAPGPVSARASRLPQSSGARCAYKTECSQQALFLAF
ncbi:MAG: hypothetical protein NT138_18890 [Planctomycetales bacterium]|nr:hypothetical protein [Planctomycetales bacterium]